MGTKQKLKREYFKKSYAFSCCKCNHKQYASPSIMMTGFGLNSGNGNCIKCGIFLHLKIEGRLDGEVMVSEIYDDFLKKQEVKS